MFTVTYTIILHVVIIAFLAYKAHGEVKAKGYFFGGWFSWLCLLFAFLITSIFLPGGM